MALRYLETKENSSIAWGSLQIIVVNGQSKSDLLLSIPTDLLNLNLAFIQVAESIKEGISVVHGSKQQHRKGLLIFSVNNQPRQNIKAAKSQIVLLNLSVLKKQLSIVNGSVFPESQPPESVLTWPRIRRYMLWGLSVQFQSQTYQQP